MADQLTLELLEEFFSKNDIASIRDLANTTHPGTIAELLDPFTNSEIWQILHMLDVRKRADIFSNLKLEKQVELVTGENRRDMAKLLEEMPPDDRADLVQELDENLLEEILPLVAKAEREDIRKLVQYEEGTAGAAMSTDYAVFNPDISVLTAIENLRVQAPRKETIYYVYVVDHDRKLVGFVSLKRLITARSGQRIKDIMRTDVIKSNVNEDQETVAKKIEKFDIIAIPIVDNNNVLVGIVTHDDAIDIIRQEQTEDMEKFMAISGSHDAADYVSTSPWEHFKRRYKWVFFLGILSLLAGLIIQRFEDMLVEIVVLATFIPMIADAGGNVGSQTATLVIRALALGEIKSKDIFKVLLKEFQIALPLAALMAALAFGRLMLFAGSEGPEYSLLLVGTAVGVALALQVISSIVIGAVLPLAASALKFDPAVVASPALTTTVDITGLLIFFTVVATILGL